MTQWCLVKEFHKFLKNVNKMSDGQAAVSDWDDENVATFKLQIKPHSGAYRGGTFDFTVTLPENFPEFPPIIVCETPIYHPNIDFYDDDDNVCLNMFNEGEWQEGYGLDGVIQGVLFLFYQPNMDDPLSPFLDETMEEFEKNVLLSLKGGKVKGSQFPWNYDGERGEEEKPESVNSSQNECVETMIDNSVGNREESTPEPNAHCDQASVMSYSHRDQADSKTLSSDDCSSSYLSGVVSTTTDYSRRYQKCSARRKLRWPRPFISAKNRICRFCFRFKYCVNTALRRNEDL